MHNVPMKMPKSYSAPRYRVIRAVIRNVSRCAPKNNPLRLENIDMRNRPQRSRLACITRLTREIRHSGCTLGGSGNVGSLFPSAKNLLLGTRFVRQVAAGIIGIRRTSAARSILPLPRFPPPPPAPRLALPHFSYGRGNEIPSGTRFARRLSRY